MSGQGKVYGQALYALAVEEGSAEEILHQLQVLQASFRDEPNFLRLMSVANVAVAERCQILDRCFRDSLHIYVLNMLKLMTEKSVIRDYSACLQAYTQQYNADHNILPVTATTAVALTQDQVARLTQKLSAITGKQAQLQNRVDPDYLGGVRLDYDGKCVDGSVRNRLETIRKQLQNTVL